MNACVATLLREPSGHALSRVPRYRESSGSQIQSRGEREEWVESLV